MTGGEDTERSLEIDDSTGDADKLNSEGLLAVAMNEVSSRRVDERNGEHVDTLPVSVSTTRVSSSSS